MKITSKALSLAVLISAALLVGNCGGGGSETPVEKVQLDKLKGTWNIVSAELDGTPRTGDFTGFTLTIGGTFDKDAEPGDFPYTFSVGGSRPTPSPWPGTGTWEFGGDPKTQVVRNDGVGITYSINSSGVLTMIFTCPDGVCDAYAGAKVGEVDGNWEFVLD